MRVLICVNNSLRFCPYAYLYIDLCKDIGADFSVLYPDRGMLNEEFPFSTIRYEWNNRDKNAIQLFKYRHFASRFIKNNDFDFIVALSTGAAVLLANPILKSKKKYIVDVRDYTRENQWLYYKIEERILKHAECVIISSPGFREFLPKGDYVDIYNISNQGIPDNIFEVKKSLPIVIGYVGTVAYPEQVESLMNLVEKDTRFRFEIYGNDPNGERINHTIDKKGYRNTIYYGPYNPENKPSIIKKVDILFNAYGNDSPLLKYALSNKLTDAAMYKKVVLNSPQTSMHSFLGPCSFDIDLNTAKSLNELYKWYSSLDGEYVQSFLSNLLLNIEETNEIAKRIIIEKMQQKNGN